MYLAPVYLKKCSWLDLHRYWKLIWFEKDANFTSWWLWLWQQNHFGVHTEHPMWWTIRYYVESILEKIYAIVMGQEFS